MTPLRAVASTDAETITTTAATDPADPAVPGWFDLVALVGPIGLVAFGSSALVLALFGRYSLGAALLVGVPLATLGVVSVGRRLLRSPAARRREHLWAVAALGICLAAIAANGFRPAQHVIVEADPGGYAATAKWISRDGSLVQDIPSAPFEQVTFASVETPGVYDVGDGRLEFQFDHLTGAVLAVGLDLAGPRLMFRLPALAGALGLLPFYSVVARVVRRSWLAAASVAALVASLPFVAFTRDTYSEPFTLLLLWGGILLLGLTVVRTNLATAVLAGALLGATTMARIDAVLYLVPVPLIAAWLATRGRRGGVAALGLVAAGAVTYAIGAIDLWAFTGRYSSDLAGSRRQLDLLLLASCAVAVAGYVVATRWPAWVDRARASAGRLAMPVAGAAAVVALAMWLLRPLVQEVHTAKPEWWGLRLYSEHSGWWLAWYLGPLTLVLSIAGLGCAVFAVMKRRRRAWTALLLLYVVPSAAIYLWRPSITPMHVWAMRRYLPVVLPGVIALAAFAIGWLLATPAATRLPARARGGLAAGAALLLVAQPLFITWPVRALQERRAYLIALQEACRTAGDDAAVLVFAGGAWAQSVRSWCGLPAAWANLRDPPSAAQVEDLASEWAKQCRRLVLLADDPASLSVYAPVTGPLRQTSIVGSNRSLVRTWERPPRSYTTDGTRLTLAPVTIEPTCSPTPTG